MSTDSMLLGNAFDGDARHLLDPVEQDLVRRRMHTFGNAVPLFYGQPLNPTRAEGVWLFDHLDRPYLDAYNNVPCVGHCHPRVVKAIAEQAARLNTHTRYLSEVVSSYAERLLAEFEPSLSRVLFTSSGTESVDLALRIARYHTGAEGIIVTRFAYHGHSAAVAEITPAFGAGVPIGRDVRTVAVDAGLSAGGVSAGDFADAVAQAIDDLRRHGVGLAALIVDTSLSSDGLFVDPAGFLRPAVELAQRAGGLFIADEVQPGFGRLGHGMWGYSRHGVSPDLVVLGKPMGNGMPIAAVVSKPELLASFAARTGYFNTFGGNTVCCAAAAAVLNVIKEEGLIEHAALVGQHLRAGLGRLQRQTARIAGVRGAGLYAAVEIVGGEDGTAPDRVEALRLVNGLRARRILISTCGAAGNVLKIRPPLPFSAEHADLLTTTLEELLLQR